MLDEIKKLSETLIVMCCDLTFYLDFNIANKKIVLFGKKPLNPIQPNRIGLVWLVQILF